MGQENNSTLENKLVQLHMNKGNGHYLASDSACGKYVLQICGKLKLNICSAVSQKEEQGNSHNEGNWKLDYDQFIGGSVAYSSKKFEPQNNGEYFFAATNKSRRKEIG